MESDLHLNRSHNNYEEQYYECFLFVSILCDVVQMYHIYFIVLLDIL